MHRMHPLFLCCNIFLVEICIWLVFCALLTVHRKSDTSITQLLYKRVGCMQVAFTALVQKKCAPLGNRDYDLATGEKLSGWYFLYHP